MARLIPVVQPALHALRNGWRHAVLVALVGAAAVTVLAVAAMSAALSALRPLLAEPPARRLH